MKQGPNAKRSRGRGGPRRPNFVRGQPVNSNGPDVRIRGSVSQVLEKYLSLARDATSAGDYVSAENYYQHAEHYFRVRNPDGGASPRGDKAGEPRPSKGNGMNGRAEARAEGSNGGDAASPDGRGEASSSEADPSSKTVDTEPDTR